MHVSGYETQGVLFAARPTRLALQQLELAIHGSSVLSINVWRNHAIEPVLPSMLPYLAVAGYATDVRLSDYDDALMFAGHRPADIDILWLDSSRYLDRVSFEEWSQWLISRIKALRSMTSAPIILATWFEDIRQVEQMKAAIDAVPATYLGDLQMVSSEEGVLLVDPRTAAMAGTPLSNAAQVVVARKLACHWISAAIRPPIKVVALDLDNTLHDGVLGEDGIDGVQLTPAHRALQEFLKSLGQRGVFLALVSRNEPADVVSLFERRKDFPLRWEDFSATEISWGHKADGLRRIATSLRVAADSVLFVDDNLGELADVTSQLPQVYTVYAGSGPSQTERAIEYCPGLWRWKIESEDAMRAGDMKANVQREEILAEAASPSESFRALQVTLFLRCDPQDQLSRLADLCRKTNQFNLAMRRLNQVELAERLERPDACVASVQMQDRLSDSGVIAVIAAMRDGSRLVIEELCISCRAMGRYLEDTMILTSICGMPLFSNCTDVVFCVQHGPRNQPALDWLTSLLSKAGRPEPGQHVVSADLLRTFIPPDGVTLVRP